MYSDDSLYYETTYSQDQRIEKSLKKIRKKRQRLAEKEDLKRQETFQRYFESDLPVLKLHGFRFLTFRHSKIKFSFQPSQIANFISRKVLFYVSLRYREKNWRVKRDTLPANYKWRIYKLFYAGNFFAVGDENILETLFKVYEILVNWTNEEQSFRLDKFEKYKQGEDIELDSDDEELFLNEDERRTVKDKRNQILKRMIPPPAKTRRRRQKRQHKA